MTRLSMLAVAALVACSSRDRTAPVLLGASGADSGAPNADGNEPPDDAGGRSSTGGGTSTGGTGGLATTGGAGDSGGAGATATAGRTGRAGGTSTSGGTGGKMGSSGRGGTSGKTGGSAGIGAAAGSSNGGTATRSAACGTGSPEKGDFHRSTTDGDGTTRDYEVVVPSSYSNDTPLALTVVYHGLGGTEADAKSFGLQEASGAAAASIFVFPQGIEFQSYGVGWDDNCSGRDMKFFDHLLDELGSTYCIDLSKVFVAGFSWGCDHVTSLACCRGTKLAAIAAASCTDEFRDAADYETYNNLPCPGATEVGVRFTHDANGDGAFSAQQFATTSALFRSFDGCSSSATTSGSCSAFEGCAKPVLECAYAGLGHALPASWAADTWSFFEGF